MNVKDQKSYGTILLLALLGLGIIVRLYAAWCFRHNLNLDAGVVALMAKHIAEGSAFPVFFYGQAHMGSLEALFSGLFCRLFGITGFNVCLGTAFVSFGLLPIVYRWARDAAGRGAGLAALAFIVIGPGGFFHYNASPRGAYAAALTFGAFLLWTATRMAIRWQTRREQSGWDFFLLGLGAGLAWWSSQLTTAAILSAALLLLVALRRHAFTWRLGSGLGGFFLGSAPFWIYNALNGWPSFAFAETFGRVRLRDGLYWFFTDRFTSLMLPGVASGAFRNLALALYVAAAAGALALLIHAFRTRRTPLFFTLFGIALFTALFSILYASSHFAAVATPRYFLPMVAPIAVLLGILTHVLARRVPFPLAVLPLLVLIVGQLPSLQWAYRFEQREQAALDRIRVLGEKLEEQGIHTLYARNVHRSWTFAVRESAAFVDVMGECYHPHAQRAETTPDIAVLDNYGMMDSFLSQTRGMARRQPTGPFLLHDQFEPPPIHIEEIRADRIARMHDVHGNDLRNLILGPRIDTEWRPLEPPGQRILQIAFSEPVLLAGFRLYSMYPNEYPREWRVSASSDGGTHWKELQPATPLSRYFWSGPRPYWGEPFFRLEFHIEPQQVTDLRIEDISEQIDWRWLVQRLQLFTRPATPYEPLDVPLLVRTLRERSIRFLFCDRGLSHTIYRLSEGAIATPRDPAVFDDAPPLQEGAMTLTPHTALLVAPEEIEHTRRILEEFGLSLSEEAWGSYRLFSFADDPSFTSRKVRGLVWLGRGAALDEASRALDLYTSAQELFEVDPLDPRAPTLLNEALTHHPQLSEAVELQSRMRALHGLPPADDPFVPDVEAVARFRNGITLLGYSGFHRTDASTESVHIRYHWHLPERIDPNHYAVFVHFRNGREMLFQDDHVLLDSVPRAQLRTRSVHGLFYVDRIVFIPEYARHQPFDLHIGLLDRRTGERLRVRTDLPERRNTVKLPPRASTR